MQFNDYFFHPIYRYPFSSITCLLHGAKVKPDSKVMYNSLAYRT